MVMAPHGQVMVMPPHGPVTMRVHYYYHGMAPHGPVTMRALLLSWYGNAQTLDGIGGLGAC